MEENKEINKDIKDNDKSKTIKTIIIIVLSTILLIVLLLLPFFIKLYINASKMYLDEKKKSNNYYELLNGQFKKEGELLRNAEKSYINEYGLSLEKANYENYISTGSYLTIDSLQKKVNLKYNIECSEKESYKDGTVYLKNCSVKDLNSFSNITYGTKKENIVTEDNVEKTKNEKVIVYEEMFNNRTFYSLNKPTRTKDYKIHEFDIKTNCSSCTSVSGEYLAYVDMNDISQLIDLKEDKRVLEEENVEGVFLYNDNSNYESKYAAVYKNKKYYLYDLVNKKYLSDVGYDEMGPNIETCGITAFNIRIPTIYSGNVVVIKDHKYGIVDAFTGKEIVPLNYNRIFAQGQFIIAENDNTAHLYSKSAKRYLTDEIENVYAVINNAYVIVKKDNHIKLLLLDGVELYDYGEYDIKSVHMTYSDAEEVKAELYEEEKNFKCAILKYDFLTKKGSIESEECAGISKPILYFYPKKNINVKVTFDNPSLLKTTYPKYDNGWNVSVKKDGSIYDKDGKYYYALYWDEYKVHTVDFKEGFYVTKENAIEFLEEKLSYIGLNDKERNEFIMYWLPILENNNKSLVYFELTDERNSYSKINISPKPDSMLRLVIHIKKVDKETSIKQQKLTKFKRTGFSVVEWGGTTY